MSQQTTERRGFDQIVKAYLNSHCQVVFNVSTKEIFTEKKSSSEKLVRLPCEKILTNVRFDIDSCDEDCGQSIWDALTILFSPIE